MRHVLIAALLAALAPFAYAAEQVPAGDVVTRLDWKAPTHNTDGSVLTDLAGHELHWGYASGDYFTVVDVPGGQPGAQINHNATVTVTGNHGDVVTVFFAAKAYDDAGNRSAFSNEVSKVFELVDNVPPNPPAELMFGVQVTFIGRTPSGGRIGLREAEG